MNDKQEELKQKMGALYDQYEACRKELRELQANLLIGSVLVVAERSYVLPFERYDNNDYLQTLSIELSLDGSKVRTVHTDIKSVESVAQWGIASEEELHELAMLAHKDPLVQALASLLKIEVKPVPEPRRRSLFG